MAADPEIRRRDGAAALAALAEGVRASARLVRRLAGDRRGIVMVEFAYMLPVVATLVLGGVEFARYAMITQKMDRVSGFVGDLVARAKSLEAADFDDYFAAAGQLAAPYDLMAGGNIIVSSVTGEAGGPRVLWQQVGPGSVAAPSAVGIPGAAAVLPAGFVLGVDENIVVTEVFFDFEPMFVPAAFVDADLLRFRSVYRPRTTAVLAMQQ